MFSRGNISEKLRFSELDVTDEIIIDMFVGIGYWVLQLAKHQRPRKLICIDKNPDAITALKVSNNRHLLGGWRMRPLWLFGTFNS